MAKIVQVLTRPSKEYEVTTAEAQVRDLDAIAFVLNKLNILELASTKVTVILAPDPASSDTNIDFITAVFALGTVYSVVKSVVVKSTFLFLKLLAIIVKRSFELLPHP